MDSIRHIIATSSLQATDSGIDGCTTTSSSCCVSSLPPPANANHSQSEATSGALHDVSDVNLPVDDSPLTEDEALSEDDDSEVVAEVLDAIDRNNGSDNNRLFQHPVIATSGRLPSKEEKQRQNEEIVIMESSSVSSETGSWESVFPQRTPEVAAAEAVLPESKTRTLPEFSFSSKPMCSAAAACFIDASSLMDENEMYASQIGPHLPEVGCCGPKPVEDATEEAVDSTVTKMSDADLHSPNLSDEQKLLHRVVPAESYDIKDQFSLGSHHSSSESPPDSTVPSSQDEGISMAANHSDHDSRHRQDLERKQGHFLFRNSIQHYSGHVPLRSGTFNDDNQSCSDMSLPSVYSTGSNEYGHQQYDSSNFGDYAGGAANSDAESGFYPDTPHNSIVMHMDPEPPVRKVVAAEQVCRGYVEQPAEIRPFDSPSVRRKTETCPIMSGGLCPEDIAPAKPKPPLRDRSLSSSLNSWVVDMSDCQQSPKSTERARTAQSLDPKRLATGFFVDMSDSDCSLPPMPTTTEEPVSGDDKKNLFSMFIDFGEKKALPRKEPASFTSRLTSSIQKQRQLLSNSSDTESDREKPSAGASSTAVKRTSTAKRIAADARNRHSWNESQPITKVNSSATITKPNPRQFNSSVSMPDGESNTASSSIMSIFDKIPSLLQHGAKLITNTAATSSMSIDSPVSPFDDLTSCKSMSVYSNNSGKSLTSASVHSSVHEDDPPAVVRRRRQDVDINETFDKSSRSSLPEELLSTDDTSPITDTDDVTFQNDLEPDPIQPEPPLPDADTSAAKSNAAHTMESLQAIMERQQKLLLETVTEEPPPVAVESSFVKLSDMDKPVPKFELHGASGGQRRGLGGDDGLSKSLGAATTSRIERLFADNAKQSRSRNPWHTMSRSTG